MHDKITQLKITQLLAEIKAGSPNALARGITIVENNLQGHEQILHSLRYENTNKVVGITGPPGAGKSTLVNALLTHWSQQGKKLAVIAVDPSSPFNYGALLGDRIRLNEFYNNPNVYIRSLASRGALGGLNAKIIEITDLVKQAPFDIILVETVGVGQSEVEIAGLADCSVVALVPEAGDEVQTLKAGIMEIADVFVVNKADRDSADALFKSLKIMVHSKEAEYETPVVKTIATTNTGINELATHIETYLQNQSDNKEQKLNLLTEKCWQIIQSLATKDIDKHKLKTTISAQINTADFNIYKFAANVLKRQQ